MRYTVIGRDNESGQVIELVVDAEDVRSAAAIAEHKDIKVTGVRAVGSNDANARHSTARRRKAPPPKPTRFWLVLLILGAGVIAPWWPSITLGAGVILLVMVLLYLLLPPTRHPVGSFLRVSPQKPRRRVVKLTTFVLTGLVMLVISNIGYETVRNRKEHEAKREVVRQAQEQERIKSTARVMQLIKDARGALDSGDVSAAESSIATAVSIRSASNTELAKSLQRKIQRSTDEQWLRGQLLKVSDEEFAQLYSNDVVPEALDFGFSVLTDRAMGLARPQLDELQSQRVEIKRQMELAAEAERIAKAERVAAERQAAEERAIAKREAQEAAQQELQDKLDTYMAILELAEVSLVDSVRVQRITSTAWEAELTVKNLWHVRHYQIRLQDAQALWEAWALIASPDNVDSARIKIVDSNGNAVGGSRVWGGSLIWVQKD